MCLRTHPSTPRPTISHTCTASSLALSPHRKSCNFFLTACPSRLLSPSKDRTFRGHHYDSDDASTPPYWWYACMLVDYVEPPQARVQIHLLSSICWRRSTVVSAIGPSTLNPQLPQLPQPSTPPPPTLQRSKPPTLSRGLIDLDLPHDSLSSFSPSLVTITIPRPRCGVSALLSGKRCLDGLCLFQFTESLLLRRVPPVTLDLESFPRHGSTQQRFMA